MATGSLLVKTTIIYLCVSIMLYAGGVRFTDSNSSFNSFITAQETNGQNQYNIGNITGVMPNVNEQSTFSTGVNFIDAIRAVRAFIELIVNVVFAIPTLFFSFPSPIQLFFGVPLAVIAFLGLIYFTRSGQ
jgi:hypothetical protein